MIAFYCTKKKPPKSCRSKGALVFILSRFIGTGRGTLVFFELSYKREGFKKRRRSVLFLKFAPRREREAESQGQKRGGGSPKLQAECRNLGKPLFCSYYPLLSKIIPPLGGRGGEFISHRNREFFQHLYKRRYGRKHQGF